MIVQVKEKQLSPKKRRDLLITWNGIKFRHHDIDIRNEWRKYVAWLRRKGMPSPEPSIISILAFERRWLKKHFVKRISSSANFIERKKEITEDEIKRICDQFAKREIQVTEPEVRELFTKKISAPAIEIWFATGQLPKERAFKHFLAKKGRY